MLSAATGLLACPVCGLPLDVGARPVTCASGHSYDVARQGYLNLLGSAPPANADTADMVAARERVLAAGVFDAVDEALAHALASCLRILDAGGGTGHHLARVLDRNRKARGLSIDVSVPAARRAARAHERLASVVADTWSRLPVLPDRLDAVLCIFAPRNADEFARVLPPGGTLIVVTPEQDHLDSLRATHSLLDIDADKAERLHRTLSTHFEPVDGTRLESTVSADSTLARDLIAMGPNAFHVVPDHVGALTTRVAVSVAQFRRRDS